MTNEGVVSSAAGVCGRDWPLVSAAEGLGAAVSVTAAGAAAASDSPFLSGLDPFMSTRRISLRVIELRMDFLATSDFDDPLEVTVGSADTVFFDSESTRGQ